MLGGTLLLSHRRIRTAAFPWQIWPPKSLLLPSPVSSPLPALGPTFCPLLTASGLTFHCFLSSPASSILDPGAAGMIFLKHRLGPVTPHLSFKLLTALRIRAKPLSLHTRPSLGERSCLLMYPSFVPLGIGQAAPLPAGPFPIAFNPCCLSQRPFPWKPC